MMCHSNGKLTRLGITSKPPENAPSDHALQDKAQFGSDPGVRIHRPVKRQQNTRGTEALGHIHYVTVYKMSFFPRTIQRWNELPSTIADIQKIEAFKTALHASIAVQPPTTA